MDRGAWWASPWGHKELDTIELLSTYNYSPRTHTHTDIFALHMWDCVA